MWTVPPPHTGCPDLDELAQAQCAVLSREQLRSHDVSRHRVRSEIRARRWRPAGPRVLVLHSGAVDPAARRWIGLLHAGPHAALAAWTAAEIGGLTGWERAPVHVVVPRGTLVPHLDGLVVHESRRLYPADLQPAVTLRRTRTPRSVLDAAAWSRTARVACGLLAAAVAQRVVTVAALEDQLHAAGAVAHRRAMGHALADIDGGSRALSEIDFIRMCRRHGLPPPRQQAVRVIDGRRRYLDAEWVRGDGLRVVAEVDGHHHLDAATWWADLSRQNEITLGDSLVLRFPTVALRMHEAACMQQLARALQVPVTPPAVSGSALRVTRNH